MEFACPAWSPWLQKDVDVLEKVQEKFVKNVSGLQSGSYHDKLRELKLLSLKDRRVFLDLVELFKMIKGFTNVNYRGPFL